MPRNTYRPFACSPSTLPHRVSAIAAMGAPFLVGLVIVQWRDAHLDRPAARARRGGFVLHGAPELAVDPRRAVAELSAARGGSRRLVARARARHPRAPPHRAGRARGRG